MFGHQGLDFFREFCGGHELRMRVHQSPGQSHSARHTPGCFQLLVVVDELATVVAKHHVYGSVSAVTRLSTEQRKGFGNTTGKWSDREVIRKDHDSRVALGGSRQIGQRMHRHGMIAPSDLGRQGSQRYFVNASTVFELDHRGGYAPLFGVNVVDHGFHYRGVEILQSDGLQKRRQHASHGVRLSDDHGGIVILGLVRRWTKAKCHGACPQSGGSEKSSLVRRKQTAMLRKRRCRSRCKPYQLSTSHKERTLHDTDIEIETERVKRQRWNREKA